MTETSRFLERSDGERLAWRRVAGEGHRVAFPVAGLAAVGGLEGDCRGISDP